MTTNGVSEIGQGLTELQATGSKLPSKIFVGGLAEQTKENHIREAFFEIDPTCPVLTVKIIVDRSIMTKSNEPRRYAFVEFATENEVKKILDLIVTQNKALDLHNRRLTVGQAYRKAPNQQAGYQFPGFTMIDPMAYLRAYQQCQANMAFMPKTPILTPNACYPMMPAVDYSTLLQVNPYNMAMMNPYGTGCAMPSPQVVPGSPYMKPMTPTYAGTVDNGYMQVPMSSGNGSCGSVEEAVPDSYPYKFAPMQNGSVNGDGRRGVPHTVNVPQQQPATQMNPRYVNQSPASGQLSGDSRHYVPAGPAMRRQYGQ